MDHQRIKLCTYYLGSVFDPKAQNRMIRDLRHGHKTEDWDDDLDKSIKTKHAPFEFDTLVGTGLSGALLLPKIANALKVDYLIVRKENDGSHSGNIAEGHLGNRWMFFDDLIDGGTTFNRVYKAVNKIVKKENESRWANRSVHKIEFAGAYLYNSNRSFTPDDLLDKYGERMDFHPKCIKREQEAAEAKRKEEAAKYELWREEKEKVRDAQFLNSWSSNNDITQASFVLRA